MPKATTDRFNAQEAAALLALLDWAATRYPPMANGCLLDPFDALTTARDKLRAFRRMTADAEQE